MVRSTIRFERFTCWLYSFRFPFKKEQFFSYKQKHPTTKKDSRCAVVKYDDGDRFPVEFVSLVSSSSVRFCRSNADSISSPTSPSGDRSTYLKCNYRTKLSRYRTSVPVSTVLGDNGFAVRRYFGRVCRAITKRYA